MVSKFPGLITITLSKVFTMRFSRALVSSSAGHESDIEKIKEYIVRLKQIAGIRK